MYILHIIHWPKSGITTFLKHLADASSGNVKYGVIFLVADQTECQEMERNGIPVYDLSGSGFVGKLLKIRSIYRKLPPDIVHLHSFTPSLLHMFAARKKFRTIRTIHCLYPYFFENTIRSIFKRAAETYTLRQLGSNIVGVSDDVVQKLPLSYSSLDCSVIINGIKIPDSIAVGNKTTVQIDGLNFLTIGRLEYEKGYDQLIKAVSILSMENLLIKFTIVGEGTQRKELEALAKELGIDENIQFTGYLHDPFSKLEVSSYCGFISSSRYEGFGIAIAEAMASRLPVVTTNSGGFTNSLQDGRNAIVVGCSAELIADGIRRFSQMTYEDKTAIGMRGYELVANHYSIQKTVTAYEILYQSKHL